MKESNSDAGKRTDPRPAYMDLGDDTDGAYHIYRTTNKILHVVQECQYVQKFVLNGRSVDDYLNFVRNKIAGREWANYRYVANGEDLLGALVEQLADSTEVAA